jgi:hypothetical protein
VGTYGVAAVEPDKRASAETKTAGTHPMAHDLEHLATHKRFAVSEPETWTTAYSFPRDGDEDVTFWCAFADPQLRARALSDPGWDLTIGSGGPGFSKSWDDKGPVITYDRWGGGDGVEPFVLSREFYGARPGFLEVVEEFRLFHNLYPNADGTRLMKPHDDGTSEEAVEIGPDTVRVRTKHLRQYQAARQLDFLWFVDARAAADPPDAALPAAHEWKTVLLNAVRYPNTLPSTPITRYLGTRVFPPPPVERAGVWPYETPDNNFPEFIVGEDGDGSEVQHSCDPAALSNYFGANPGEPHYLTPVYFRREVLQKYYNNPELYTVRDGRLICVSLWSVAIDNDSPEFVVVFLGDLGRDLPSRERDYWRSYNVPPGKGMSETGVRRAFLGQYADPQAPDLTFRHTYQAFGKAWTEAAGFPLLREPAGPDRSLPDRLRIPLSDSNTEFEEAVRILAKILCDALNDKELARRLPDKIPKEQSISKLERWLTAESYPHTQRDVAFLRRLQALRSKTAAHLKGSAYDQDLAKLLGNERGEAAVRTLLQEARTMLESLIEWRSSSAADSPGPGN